MNKPHSPEHSVEVLKALCPDPDDKPKENRCQVYRGFGDADRYLFDFTVCLGGFGWHQYDSQWDAPWYGCWYNADQLSVFEYCEGDMTLVVAPDEEAFKAELAEMAESHGEPPPAFIVIDCDNGTVTNVYDPNARPNLD